MVNASSTFHPIELMHAYLDFDYRATILADFQMPQWWSERRNYLFAIVLKGKGPAPGSRRHCHCRDDGWNSVPTTSLRHPPCRYPESIFAYLTLLQVPHPDQVALVHQVTLAYFRVNYIPKKWSKVRDGILRLGHM